MERIREPAILLALYLAPSASSGLIDPITLMFRNVAFGLLVLYLLESRSEMHILASGSDRRSVSRAISLLTTSTLIVAVLVLLSFSVQLLDPILPDYQHEAFLKPHEDLTGMRLLLLAVAMVIAAYVEELFFRAYLLRRFRLAGIRRGIAVFVAATLFALGHSRQGSVAVVFAWCAGVLLGAFWVMNPRFDALVIGHTGYNLLVLLMHRMG